MYAPAYGFPATLEYYMIDKTDAYPRHILINTEKFPDQFVQESVSNCKAVLAYEEDIDKVARFVWIPDLQKPYFRAIAEWVKQMESGYTRAGTYHFITEDGYLTLHLYLKSNSKLTDQMTERAQNETLTASRMGYLLSGGDDTAPRIPIDQFHSVHMMG
jgi:hypothetical protein